MKTITVDRAMSFGPCYDRAWVEARFAGRKRLSVAEIAALADVTDADKVWLFVRMMGRRMRVLFACDCAARALPLWEARAKNRTDLTQNQKRTPNRVIRAARMWARGKATLQQMRAACAATCAISDAAAYAAYAAYFAADAATCAISDAAASAACAAAEAASGPAAYAYAERAWQVKRAVAYLTAEVK